MKNREELKSAIISRLNEKPLSIQQISEKVKSNWLTVSSVLEELKNEGKVREIIATEKIKVFRSVDYPVFYSVPLKKEIIDNYLFIFSEIIKQWQKLKNELPTTTALHKTAVDVVSECKLDLPIIRFHYGLVSPIAVKPEENLEKKYNFEATFEKDSIIRHIKNITPEHTKENYLEEDKQYDKYKDRYGMHLFIEKKKLLKLLNGKKQEIKELENQLTDVFLRFPNSNDDNETFLLFDRFLSSSIIILNSKKFHDNKNIQAIKETFDSIWDLTTSHLFFKDLKKYIEKEDFQTFELIRTTSINTKMENVEEKLLTLESISNSVDTTELRMPMDEESIRIMDIMTEGIEEE